MIYKRKIRFSFTIPMFVGVVVLLSLITTCQKHEPEISLEITTDAIEMQSDGEYRFTGTIVSFGTGEITQHGFCWSTASNPTADGQSTKLGARATKGSFSSFISGLSLSTQYFVRAYAVSSSETVYGNEKTFMTPDPGLPALSTIEVSDVTREFARSGGIITDDGGSPITAKGVCWDTLTAPTIDNKYTSDGDGSDSYESALTGLNCSTKYYVRAYATNAAGTSYGNQKEFTMDPCLLGDPPTVTTDPVSNITTSSAEGGGVVTDEGGSEVTARGVCWSTSHDPVVTDGCSTDGTGAGGFTSSISGLSPYVTYYIRAYATNRAGTVYGEEFSFRTFWDNSAISDVDGNVYSTVQIAEQVWLGENLKVTHYADGAMIPLVTSETEWKAFTDTSRAYCWYDNNSANGTTYGALYTWGAAMNGAASTRDNPSGVQGVCPAGWHLPSDAEWTELSDYLGGSDVAGGKLKETGTSHWDDPNEGATDEFGFTALPAGTRDYDGKFYNMGGTAHFWPATEATLTATWERMMSYHTAILYRTHAYPKDCGFSVRCVKD